MGNTESYIPKYKTAEYTKIRPGKNIYKKDTHTVYWQGQIVPNAKVDTFVDLGSGYGQDDNHIFYKGRTILDNRRKSLRVKTDGYAKYGQRLYYNGNEIDAY